MSAQTSTSIETALQSTSLQGSRRRCSSNELPRTNQCTISFKNLSCQCVISVRRVLVTAQGCCGAKVQIVKQLFSDLTGIMTPGLNAIMGPSGSGKSTLLGVLSSRVNRKELLGHVYYNGKEKPENLGGIVGYVAQEDRMMGVLTVKENIWFSANLRLPKSVTHEDKKQRIHNIIKELDLESCQNTKIGTERVRGVSGGERKRTAIGMELVVQPRVLFLDEPTCGLDASTAQSVVMLLKWLTLRGTNIIMTINQPRFSIYRLFDSLTLIAKGRLIFHSPTHYVLPYFQNIGYSCQENENPADYLQDVISGSIDVELERIIADGGIPTQAQVDLHIERLAVLFRDSSLYANLKKQVQDEISFVRDEDATSDTSPSSHKSSFSTQFLYLSQRASRNLIRNPMALASNAIINIVVGLLFGLIYFQTDKSVVGVQNRFGFMFFACSNMMFGTLTAIELFVEERDIFLHEYKSGHYAILPYFLSKICADLLPLRTISPLLFCCLTYWMVGLKPDGNSFMIFVVTVLLLVYSAVGTGMLFSASISNYTTCLVLTALIFLFSILLNGFLINTDSMLPWLRWVEYLSIARYAFVAMSINEFHGRTFVDCTGVYDHSGYTFLSAENDTIPTMNPTVLTQAAETKTMATELGSASCVYFRGDEVLEKRLSLHPTSEAEFDGWYLWQNHVALAVITIALFVMTYIQLVRAAKKC